MSAFDDAWNVLKMGTYEEEERDMGYMPGRRGKKLTPEMIRQLMQQNRPPNHLQPMDNQDEPYGKVIRDKLKEKGYNPPSYKPYPTPPNPYRDKNQPNPFDPYRKKPAPGGHPWTPPGGPNKPPYKPYPAGDDDSVTCPDCGQKYKKGWDCRTKGQQSCRIYVM